jgi:D-alanyl-D-alanine endopeptidase (penicillin-binding protein 7)
MKTNRLRLTHNPLTVLAALAGFGLGALLFALHTSADTPGAEPVSPLIRAAEIAAVAQTRMPALRSSAALVMDAREGVTLYARDIDRPRPIASLTKLMTAMVVLDADLPFAEAITITEADRDRLRGTKSRLPFNTTFTRHDLLHAALTASENRAAAALARSYPGGTAAMIAAMNAKAVALGMTQTHFRDASGLDSGNISTARDLARLVRAASRYPLIAAFTTSEEFHINDLNSGRAVEFLNTNRLVRNESWRIGLSKTGYTHDAGNCLVMEVTIAERPVIVVLLNSWGKLSKYGDSTRIRDWLLAIERRLRARNNGLIVTQS